MIPNLPVLVACSLIPFLVAFVWYHPKVFGGDTWTKVAGLTKEQGDLPVKPLKLLLSVLLNFLIAFGMFNLAVHGFGVVGMVGGEMELLKTGSAAAVLAEYGHNHMNFGHGLVHGFEATVVFVVPLIGYATIFERKGAKYFFINVGFWLISLMLISGVLCQWGAKLY